MSRTLSRKAYAAHRATQELELLLGNPACARRAREISITMQPERGAQVATDALERLLSRPRPQDHAPFPAAV